MAVICALMISYVINIVLYHHETVTKCVLDVNSLVLFLFDTIEADRRLQIFHENLKTAEKIQSLDQGSAEYGVTKFSDLLGVYVRLCVFVHVSSGEMCPTGIRLCVASACLWSPLDFCLSSEEEFRSTYLNPLLSQWTLQRPMKPASPVQGPAPPSWDWREHGAVSPVKNQVRHTLDHAAVPVNRVLVSK